ncbi:Metalloenzyme, LuxS/M16 peptidase-like protein [Cokeromyces recurvatus]|uniref:Metalloenzyme, LuxS/M16 peptidase-like protein n=1 Tax=Cokeromyces recurvatus TaxID=90255 RepID=UPI00221EAB57|nr:Metalloenzyme, LuxS/M16 peptidase-like protein [Cokeromyces recurvatus]KAI7897970.1 Metalloenzyme, LuxS/M16 peptidase-like protein [Cokeromyces recurvatus]
MASKFLLSNFTKPLLGANKNIFQRRSLATATNLLPTLRKTILPNGFTVASEENPTSQTATVGVWIDAGSRAESEKNNGAAHFLEHMAFKGTRSRSQRDLELQIENMGGHLNAYTSREQTVYYAKAFKYDVPQAVEILSDILQHSTLDPGAIERERDVILREQEEVEKQMEEVVFDHLHATAFKNESLGLTILGPKENIQSLTRDDLSNYIKTNYTGERMILVGTGGVDHDALVRLAETHFGQLPNKLNASTSKSAMKKAVFISDELRINNPNAQQAHIAVAIEGASWTSPDYFPLLVMQSIIGSWDRSLGATGHMDSRLSSVLHNNQLANSFMSFNTSYKDTGLWGIYLISENKDRLGDLLKSTKNEWNRLSTSVTDEEVQRAKQQLKAGLLLSLDGSTSIAEDIGRQLLTSGERLSPKEVEALVSKVTVDDVRRVAQEYLQRKAAVVGIGAVDNMPNFNHI